MLLRVVSLCTLSSALALAPGCKSEKPPRTPSPSPSTAANEATTVDEPTPVDQAALVGSWKTPGADFEELTLDADGSWASFLHARPFYSGTWSLEGDTLALASDALGEPIVASKLTLDGGTLSLEIGGDAHSWTRIESP